MGISQAGQGDNDGIRYSQQNQREHTGGNQCASQRPAKARKEADNAKSTRGGCASAKQSSAFGDHQAVADVGRELQLLRHDTEVAQCELVRPEGIWGAKSVRT